MCGDSTISPCLQTLHEEESTREPFVVDDTFICKAGVTFDTIYQKTHNKGSGVFGNGGYQRIRNGNIAWHGSKGFYVLQPCWEDMAVVLGNASSADFRYWAFADRKSATQWCATSVQMPRTFGRLWASSVGHPALWGVVWWSVASRW